MIIMLLAGAAVSAGALAWGDHVHALADNRAEEARQAILDAVPAVRIIKAKLQSTPILLTLAGRTEAFESASLYPRATGYVSERKVDIGSRVKRGDLLLHIAAPELDQRLAQAIAQLGQVRANLLEVEAQVSQAEANLTLAQVTLGRALDLLAKGYQTAQNRDTLQANETSQKAGVAAAKARVAVAQANIVAQQAEVDRLRALVAFENVVAPFDGVITARNVEVGDLVNADTTNGAPMFKVKREDLLRVVVQVPQDAAAGIDEGLDASAELPQLGAKTIKAQVTRTSVALQSSAGTLTAEIDIPNPAGLIRSGMFTSVTLNVPRVRPEVTVPAEALIFDQDGIGVATVNEDDRIVVVPVKIFRDHGTSVDLAAGLMGGEHVVLDPPAWLHSGMKVAPKAERQ